MMPVQYYESVKAKIDAIRGLNKLQGSEASAAPKLPQAGKHKRILECLKRIGFSAEDLNQLNAIHVAGTQGKGSVCAFCESILRAHGFKTGFLSSPHLMEVRERIRINGKPITKAEFAAHFWKVYNKLSSTMDDENDYMPNYPIFLTIMGFVVFLSEKVDVAVIEVGMGGTNDSTSIIPQPAVCAVTTIGFDHTKQLGDTIQEIAGHKGGIFKAGCPALLAPQRHDGALQTLAYRAEELNASSLETVPLLSSYPVPGVAELGLAGKHQLQNAALAIQVCEKWLVTTGRKAAGKRDGKRDGSTEITEGDTVIRVAEPFPLTKEFLQGLKGCHWPGRSQIVKRGDITYHLDGAHTPDSMTSSTHWFDTVTAQSDGSMKILLYNTTRRRDPKQYLPPLMKCGFQYALFCPNIAHAREMIPDTTRVGLTEAAQLDWCRANEEAFIELQVPPLAKTKVFPSVSDALEWVESVAMSSTATSTSVLVTGSLYLVGATMKALGIAVQ